MAPGLSNDTLLSNADDTEVRGCPGQEQGPWSQAATVSSRLCFSAVQPWTSYLTSLYKLRRCQEVGARKLSGRWAGWGVGTVEGRVGGAGLRLTGAGMSSDSFSVWRCLRGGLAVGSGQAEAGMEPGLRGSTELLLD